MKKKYILIVLGLLCIIQTTGCGLIQNPNVKIVLSDDVRVTENQTPNENTIEKDSSIMNAEKEKKGSNESITENAILNPFSIDYDSNQNTEELLLELDKGDYFTPIFYLDGEIYGQVGKGSGMFQEGKDESDGYLVETPDTHPLLGYMKEYLYKIDKNNELVETEYKTVYS